MNRIQANFIVSMLILVTAFLGCSDDRAISPDIIDQQISDGSKLVAGDPVQFSACVKTTDMNTHMLTFYGTNDTAFAAQNCEIVRLNNGNESPIPFEDIKSGDSMKVFATCTQNNYMYAHKLRVYEECISYDVAIRDTISSIDYAEGTFTVNGRTEIITTDENTLIWGCNIYRQYFGREQMNGPGEDPTAFKPFPDSFVNKGRDTLILFTDLQVGDIVEVRANIVDESTLLAGIIKLAGENFKKCVEIVDAIASIDYETRAITFESVDWTGTICKGAKLLNVDGDAILLTDFVAGDLVWAKGIPIDETELQICQMTLQ
jgi:hypothetical protein